MFEQDYLMRIFLQFAEAIRRSWTRAGKERDPKDAANMLERAIGEATEIDGETLLSLAPESMAGIMQVSGIDSRVTEYIARSLLLASGYLREAGEFELADLRESQARAVAHTYGISLPETFEELVLLLDEADKEYSFKDEAESGMLGLDVEDLFTRTENPIELPIDQESETNVLV